jgi:hypothetical protein
MKILIISSVVASLIAIVAHGTNAPRLRPADVEPWPKASPQLISPRTMQEIECPATPDNGGGGNPKKPKSTATPGRRK